MGGILLVGHEMLDRLRYNYICVCLLRHVRIMLPEDMRRWLGQQTTSFWQRPCTAGPLKDSVMLSAFVEHSLERVREIKLHFDHKLHVMLFIY